LLKRAKEIGNILKNSKEVHIVTHIDADGITAGAIAYQTLKRMEKEFSIEFVKDLNNKFLEELKNKNYELIWFTDLGSSIIESEKEINKVVTDHHVCKKDTNFSYHLNPHLYDLDGSYDISGSGTTFLVSRAIDRKNIDLSTLAITGACGDLQDRRYNRLTGTNREILNEGIKKGFLKTTIDIQYFGRETRPVYKLLQYANDPLIPGLSNRESACISFLQELNINMKDEDNWRKWIDLSKSERGIIISNIAQIFLQKGFGHKITKKIIGEIYTLEKEEEGTELHDVKEFSTLLNSTARYGKYDVGLQVCLGNRDKWYKKAKNLLRGHRHNLVEGLQFAKEEGIEKRKYLQFFHAGTGIRDTIVGIVANMLLTSDETSNNLPIIGFAYKEDGNVKVSARGTQNLVDKGLNLSVAMKKAASKLNGVGGGHNIAAGATIPKGKEEEFLDLLENEIKSQFNQEVL